MTTPRTVAIIVNFRTPALTLELLRSLPFESVPGLSAIVVENGSGDGSAEQLRAGLESDTALARAVRVIESAENLGFTGGVNLGAAAALEDEGVEALWLLNPDTTIPAGTFEELSGVLRESGAAAVSPTFGAGERSWYGEHHFPRAFWARPSDYFRPTGAPARWWPSERYQGACALFDAAAVRELVHRDGHFLDPGFFMYWDEWECSLRLARRGGEFAIAGMANIEHVGGSTLGQDAVAGMRQFYSARNAVLVVRRNVSWWRFPALLSVRVARDLIWLANMRRQGRHPNFGSYLSGTFAGLRGRTRRWEQHPE